MEITSLLGIVDNQVEELSHLHRCIFTDELIKAEGKLIVEKILKKFEFKFKKSFREFNVLERAEVENEFTKRMKLVYKKYM